MAITATLDILHLYIARTRTLTDMGALIGILKEEVARLVTDKFLRDSTSTST